MGSGTLWKCGSIDVRLKSERDERCCEKCAALCLLGNEIAQKSITNAWTNPFLTYPGADARPGGAAGSIANLWRCRRLQWPDWLCLSNAPSSAPSWKSRISLEWGLHAWASIRAVPEKEVPRFKDKAIRGRCDLTWVPVFAVVKECCLQLVSSVSFKQNDLWLLWELGYQIWKISVFQVSADCNTV